MGDPAMLAAVAHDPTDDTPRLVYADWLDEYGGRGHHAALIRGQIAGGVYPGRFRHVNWGGGYWEGFPAEGSSLWPIDSPIPSPLNTAAGWTDVMRAALGAPWPWMVESCWVTVARGFPATLSLPLAPLLADPARIGRVVGLTGVTITDRRAREYRSSRHTPAVYGWCNTREGEPIYLPPPLWDRLVGGELFGPWKDYATNELAHAALSTAALNLCRTAAGLAPLVAPYPSPA